MALPPRVPLTKDVDVVAWMRGEGLQTDLIERVKGSLSGEVLLSAHDLDSLGKRLREVMGIAPMDAFAIASKVYPTASGPLPAQPSGKLGAGRELEDEDENHARKRARALPLDAIKLAKVVAEANQLREELPVFRCTYCGGIVSRAAVHPICTEVTGLIERDALYNHAKAVITKAWLPELTRESASRPLLFLFAAPGYGKTAAGECIIRRYCHEHQGLALGMVRPIYLDYHNGDGYHNPKLPMRLVALSLIAQFFFGLSGDVLRIASPQFNTLSNELTINMALTVIARHLMSEHPTAKMNVLLLHLDEYQFLSEDTRKEYLSQLWAWNFHRTDVSFALAQKLLVIPVVTGTYSALLGEIRLTGGWGSQSLYDLDAKPLSMEGAEAVVFSDIWLPDSPARAVCVTAWKEALRPHIASARMMPRLLWLLSTTLAVLKPEERSIEKHLAGTLTSFEMALDGYYKPTQWSATLGGTSGVLAYLSLSMRGGITNQVETPLLFTRRVPDDVGAVALPLSHLERLGALFRVEDECILPYAIICRAFSLTPALSLPRDVFRPLGQTTTWQSFERIAPWLNHLLLLGYYVRGRDVVAVRDLWRGAQGHAELLGQELAVPHTFPVHTETETWILTKKVVVKKEKLFAKVEGGLHLNVLEGQCAFVCCANNFRIDARYSLRDNLGQPVLVLEQAKHTASDVEVSSHTILTWYKEAKALMTEALPRLRVKPHVIYIFFSNRHLSDPEVMTSQLLHPENKDLLVFHRENIRKYVSDVFAFLVGV